MQANQSPGPGGSHAGGAGYSMRRSLRRPGPAAAAAVVPGSCPPSETVHE